MYTPDKKIPIRDTLSRANLPEAEPDITMIDYISVTPQWYSEFQTKTADELHAMIMKGWPDTKQETPHSTRDYWNTRDEFTVEDGTIYKVMRIVVPPTWDMICLP